MSIKKNSFDTSDKDDLENRLRDINKRLGRKDDKQADKQSETPNSASMGSAFKLSSEFISAILVGAIIGYGIDWLAGTSPLALIVFVLLGFVTGVRNLMRATDRLTNKDSNSQD